MSNEKDFPLPISEMDLPLMSNANEIRARHYMLHLKLDKQGWKQKTFEGQVIIFLQPLNRIDEKEGVLDDRNEGSSSNDGSEFQCILDCCDISFENVYEVSLPNPYKERFCCSNPEVLTFEERKNVELMRKFYR